MFTDLFIFLKVLRGCEAPKMPVLSVYYKQTTEPELTKRCILELKLWLQVTDQGQLIYSFWSHHTVYFTTLYFIMSMQGCLFNHLRLKNAKTTKIWIAVGDLRVWSGYKMYSIKVFPLFLKFSQKTKTMKTKKFVVVIDYE